MRCAWLLLVVACSGTSASLDSALQAPVPSIVHITSGTFTGSAATLDIPATSNILAAIVASDTELRVHATGAESGLLSPWLLGRTSCGHSVEMDVQRSTSATAIAHQVTIMLDAPATFTVDVVEVANISNLFGGGDWSTQTDAAASVSADYQTSDLGIAAVATCGQLGALVQPSPWMLVRPNIAVLDAPAPMTSAAAWSLTAPAESDAILVHFAPPH